MNQLVPFVKLLVWPNPTENQFINSSCTVETVTILTKFAWDLLLTSKFMKTVKPLQYKRFYLYKQ